MGWLSNVGSWFKKTIGNIGGYAKKIGEVGGNVARKIGSFSAPLGNIVGTALDSAAIAFGQPELALLGESVRAGGNLLQGWADKANQVASHVSNFGNKVSDFHASLGE